MTLSPQFLDELRARTHLSALIGRSVKLTKAGREYKGCCPFHDEKTPSFYVNDDKGFYHCFGCSAHGDAIRFLTEARGLPFIDAVKELAAAAGLDMPAPDPRSAERAERATGLTSASEAAARWFTEQLQGIGGADARAYLQKRGISEPLAKAFGIGFAPDARGKLKSALASFGDDTLVEAGLLIKVEEKEPYDRFRGRLMIPIRDQRGRTIAFGGRILDQGEPKYLNSPDTPLFDKGRTLFNVDRAGPASRKAGRLIVVEGYMDVIGLAKAGIDEAVAPNGTAVTEHQLERMWRLAEIPILCLDGDKAGQKAAVRAAHRALPMIAPGRSLAFATLPAGQDPDDLVKSGGAPAVEAVLANTKPLVDLIWESELAAAPLTTPEARAGLRQRLGDLARTIADGNVREQYQSEFRRRFDALYAAAPPEPYRGGGGGQNFRSGGQRPFGRGGRSGGFQPPLRPATEPARAIGRGGIDLMLARAVLAGLILRPELIGDHAEALSGLPLPDEALSGLRDAMVDAIVTQGSLESTDIAHILGRAGVGSTANRLLGTNGLAFSFLRSDADPLRAARDLGEAIEVLATRPAIDAALAEATRAFAASTDEAAFAEQQRLTLERAEAEQRLLALLGPEDE
ncbi:DNA primase [Sphingomonas sp. AP4-R1]|uniref:DNA primase n=1 Tax=Sphingomonas sp. AP4-R1 TaxID=2735134 RepID=UPI0014933371|nr:DNA primase [Sphingomonas sp. AP4-R1]QJU59743.1 DNA primase [Sphingomonas sp. AP4-R1]